MKPLLLLFSVVTLVAGTICAGTVDRIVAVVGNDVITASEMEDAVSLLRSQVVDPPPAESLKDQVLDQMIENRLLLIQAKAETVQVTHLEIEEALDESINEIRARFPTQEEFLEQLKEENTSVAQLKERYRDEIEEKLMVQKIIEKDLKRGITVSEKDLREFYEAKKDSIPEQPATVRLAHILIAIKPGKGAEDKASGMVAEILGRIEEGIDFATLAKKYSDDMVSSGKGGDLGFVRRGDVPIPEFEKTIFSMILAEIRVTVTPFGFHIIQVTDKKEDSVRLRHILIAVVPTKSDTLAAKRLAESIKDRATAGEDFAELAKQHSDDPESGERGGDLGFFAASDLSSPYEDVVSSLTAGEIGEIVPTEFGFHIIKLLERTEARMPTFENVKDELREILYQMKMAEKYDIWLGNLKKGSYIEKRL